MVRRLAVVGASLIAAVAAWPVVWSLAGVTLASGAGPAGQIPATIGILGGIALLAGFIAGLVVPYCVTKRPVPDVAEIGS